MNIAMEQTEVKEGKERLVFFVCVVRSFDFFFLDLDLDLFSSTLTRNTPHSKKKKQTNEKQEYVNGQLKNKYGDAFIRGNNVLYISTDKGASSS